ncbi:transglutaminaseTgpA domain-containing protein [Streptomyces spiramenti]|uniref:Transglutaminase domain-containing protein n=1 Tax=Streptomyces spiramenti TaxID=2720606 RepID=A0ABX1AKS5_9ACTN|nr:DUF3488 and transglutaminase-like domain-containing protein [Streptomyces spiramenti]NJP67709.1 transglutaminase domain-containing protein [Streptomyces spiramenti]
MGGRGRITVVAWAATMATAFSLLPLVEDPGWFLQAGLLLAMVSGVGALARWGELNAALTAAAQLLTGVLLVTLTTVPEYALIGLVPGPEAVGELGVLYSLGAQDVGSYASPAPVTEGIRLMLVTGVLAVGLAVDLLAVTLRSAAAAGLPLLAMYSAATGIAQEGTAWVYFIVAAGGFLVLLLAESSGRTTEWGRFFPGPLGQAGAEPGAVRQRVPRLRTGRRIGAAALGVAVAAPLMLPALGEGLISPPSHGGGGAGDTDIGTIAVNPVVALQDQLNQPADRKVLTYETDSDRSRDLYLRLVSLDRFDGRRWFSSENILDTIPETPWPVAGLSDAVETTEVVTTVEAEPDYAQRSLPVPVPAQEITADGVWSYDAYSRTLVAGRGQSSAGMEYEVRHLVVEPTAAQLAQAPEPVSTVITDEFTRVPADLPPVVAETAVEVTADATSNYERAVALQQWFTDEGDFTYNTDVASGTGTEAVANFLQAREGFCIHFAFAMAAMARTLDIPAQVSVGFTPGTRQADGSYEVGLHNAHAWPELYFEGVGWTRFEPTPGQGNAPSWTRPETESADPSDTDPEEPESETATPDAEEEEPAAAPDEPRRCDPMLEPEACEDPVADAGDQGAAFAVWPWIWGAAAVAALAALLLAPWLWRRRERDRRLAPGAGVMAAWEELLDSGWDIGSPPLPAETPRQGAHRVVRAGQLAEVPAAAVHRVAGSVERELYAPRGAEGTTAGAAAVAEDVRTATSALRAVPDSPAARTRVTLFPPSAVRVTQAASLRARALRTDAAARARRLVPRVSRSRG